jgi:PIN domain nuclease of toxin-antitoxin system
LEQNSLRLLAVEPAHVWALDDLPGIRGDPFDRMLAAQAAHEGMVLVTRDERVRELKVRTLW